MTDTIPRGPAGIPPAAQTIIETRGAQMFPTLTDADIARLRRFGTVRRYAQGEALARVGEPGHGLTVILDGAVEVSQQGESGPVPIVTHLANGFMGELAQLSGRPSLVDAEAVRPVEALLIPPERLRALLIAEADLGERIMRALILRRMGLLESGGGGPIIEVVGAVPGQDRPEQSDRLMRGIGYRSSDTDPVPDELVEVTWGPAVACRGGQQPRPGTAAVAVCPRWGVWIGAPPRRQPGTPRVGASFATAGTAATGSNPFPSGV